MAGHRFGGIWTELKLDAIADYFNYYNARLRDQGFRRWYIDAFAGSGSRTISVSRGGTMFDDAPILVEEVELAGSAKRALAAYPQFHELVFIESNRGRFNDLSRLREEHPDRSITCRQGDANAALKAFFGSPPWSQQVRGRGEQRGVLFLDPYGMSVEWETLQLIASTRAVDVWYLFPLEGVGRQLAHDFSKIDEAKKRALDRIFGTAAWRTDLYSTQVQATLFDGLEERTSRSASKRQIEEYALTRLRTVFSYVSPPLPLFNDEERHLFSLVCLANPATDVARAAIKKGVDWVLKRARGASASRRTSAP